MTRARLYTITVLLIGRTGQPCRARWNSTDFDLVAVTGPTGATGPTGPTGPTVPPARQALPSYRSYRRYRPRSHCHRVHRSCHRS